MTELPKNFPEYSLMYKTLSKKIQKLKNEWIATKDPTIQKEIQEEIDRIQNESNKIKSMFPENFFEDNY